MGERRPLFCILATGCAALAASPSWAAVIESGVGDLTINQGQGFKPASPGATANVGDAVMVGPGGRATVVYDDGCRVPVQAGAVSTIAPLSPCASGSYAADMAVKAAPPGAAEPAPTGFESVPLWGWGILLAGFGFLIYEDVNAANHHGAAAAPASP